MGKFVEFLKEQNGEEPYKLIVFNHSGEMVRDIKDTGLGELIQLMNKSSKSAGIETYNVDFVGCYLAIWTDLCTWILSQHRDCDYRYDISGSWY